jgi:AmmeMemoRadiSam system protein A
MMSPKKKECGVDLGLSDEEKAELIRIARGAIECVCYGKKVPSATPTTEKLKEPWGAFVTIYQKGMLRGCIGCLQTSDPLCQTVSEMAQAAASRDPRFRPVTEDELQHLNLEVSVLTPFEEIKDAEEIKVGIHGILIRKGYLSGILLPQVAAERNWDRMTFLRETCRKAGLPADAWKDKDTQIFIFSADVFQE